MKKLFRSFISVMPLLVVFNVISLNTHAAIITDIIGFNAPLQMHETYQFLHDIRDDGFIPGEDQINSVWLTWEFREIVEGDSVYDIEGGGGIPPDWEPVVFYTELLLPRDFYANVNTGVIRNQAGSGDVEIFSQKGTSPITMQPLTNNLWLVGLTLEADITKAVPEPASLALMIIAMLGLIARRYRRYTYGI